uniref:THAP domaincontaining protein 6like [Xiphosphorus maculatus] n=1 Tax=Lepeophtheirus salmonis TaxID=72036 RepID=A0A0K2UJK0_LEPSM
MKLHDQSLSSSDKSSGSTYNFSQV